MLIMPSSSGKHNSNKAFFSTHNELMNENEEDEFTLIYIRKINVFKAQIPYIILRGVFFSSTHIHMHLSTSFFFLPTTHSASKHCSFVLVPNISARDWAKLKYQFYQEINSFLSILLFVCVCKFKFKVKFKIYLSHT